VSAKAVAALFEVPLEEFTAARNALVKELRGAGLADEATRVAGLRKPSKALWMVNQLARRAPEQVQALIDATRRVRDAQQKGLAGDEVREAMREQRAALSALSAAAEARRDPALERRIHDTLQAGAMSAPEALREGRLEQELGPAGFEALLAAGVLAPERAPPRPAPKVDEKQSKVDEKKLERERLAADREAAKLKGHAEALEAAAVKAEAEAAEAAGEATRAEDAAARARTAAGKAKNEAAKARDEAIAARARAAVAQAHARGLR
jgi:hypothetical protein